MENKRAVTMRFRVNEAEENEIKRRAAKANMDMSTYVRTRCLSDEAIPDNKQNAEVVRYLCEMSAYANYMWHQTTEHTDQMKEFHRRGMALCGSIQNNY